MLCPNCSQQMNVRNVDNQIVLHCSTCGSSFFDKNGIDKITQNSAQMLTEEAQGQYVLGNQKICPKDKSILLEKVDLALPKNTILLECPSCEGIFAYPDDLLKYKGIKAPQPLSSGAFKLLPAPKSLFMLATFAVLTVAVLFNTKGFSTNTKASNIVNLVRFTKSDTRPNYLMINFTSSLSEQATVIFYKMEGEKRVESNRVIISPSQNTLQSKSAEYVYSGTLRTFDRNVDVFYSIQFPSISTPAPILEIQLN